MKPCVLAVSLIALAGPVAAKTSPLATPPAACPAAAPMAAKDAAQAAPLKRLDRLPAAHLELAVMRQVGGCDVATIKDGNRVYYAPTSGPQRIAVPAEWASSPR